MSIGIYIPDFQAELLSSLRKMHLRWKKIIGIDTYDFEGVKLHKAKPSGLYTLMRGRD